MKDSAWTNTDCLLLSLSLKLEASCGIMFAGVFCRQWTTRWGTGTACNVAAL